MDSYLELMCNKVAEWHCDKSMYIIAAPVPLNNGAVDVFEWNVSLPGSSNSIFRGGYFKVRLNFPRSAYEIMSAFFEPPIFHPNVSEFGKISAPFLTTWRDSSIREIVVGLMSIMESPILGLANNEAAKHLYINDFAMFQHRAVFDVITEHPMPAGIVLNSANTINSQLLGLPFL